MCCFVCLFDCLLIVTLKGCECVNRALQTQMVVLVMSICKHEQFGMASIGHILHGKYWSVKYWSVSAWQVLVMFCIASIGNLLHGKSWSFFA